MFLALRRAFICTGDVEVVAVLTSIIVFVAGPASNAAAVTEVACL